MKFTKKKYFAALLAVLGVLAIVMGAVVFHNNPNSHHVAWYVLSGLTMLAGTATVIPTYPIVGTFPTSAQAVSCNTQIYRVNMADGDTTAVLTHNWGISAAALAQFLPLISMYSQNAGVSSPVVSFALTDSNTVTLTKTGTTGGGGTFVVTVQRPWSGSL